eukprot:5328385-Pleurochrysis_carterae.AAC.1
MFRPACTSELLLPTSSAPKSPDSTCSSLRPAFFLCVSFLLQTTNYLILKYLMPTSHFTCRIPAAYLPRTRRWFATSSAVHDFSFFAPYPLATLVTPHPFSLPCGTPGMYNWERCTHSKRTTALRLRCTWKRLSFRLRTRIS